MFRHSLPAIAASILVLSAVFGYSGAFRCGTLANAATATESAGEGYEFLPSGNEPLPVDVPCPVPLESMSLPALTVALALVDGVNPCAFFVLFFLMSLMMHARSRSRMALVGGVFVLISGLVYFLFMAAWLEVFLIAGMRGYINRAAGAVALVLAAINIKDFFFFRRGVSLGIPEAAKPGLFSRMRGLLAAGSVAATLAGTVLLAFAANSYELLCTAGIPMVYTRILTMQDVSGASFYGYLALYNSVYVLPLAAIVTVSAVTLGHRKLTERHGRLLKLLSGNMMLFMGGALILRPSLMTSAASALLVVALSVVLTGLVAVLYGERGTGGGTKTPGA